MQINLTAKTMVGDGTAKQRQEREPEPEKINP